MNTQPSEDKGVEPVEVQYEVWQHGEWVAGADRLADAQHYMAMYGQDGPVEPKTCFSYRVPGHVAAHPLPSPVVSSGLCPLQAEERPSVPSETEADGWAGLERLARDCEESEAAFWRELNDDSIPLSISEGRRDRAIEAFSDAADPSTVLELIAAARASSVGTERSGVNQSPPIVPGVREALVEALDKAVVFNAYSLVDPLALRLEFSTEQDRLDAANAIDDAILALNAFRGSGHE